jgi:hypothetical protein
LDVELTWLDDVVRAEANSKINAGFCTELNNHFNFEKEGNAELSNVRCGSQAAIAHSQD